MSTQMAVMSLAGLLILAPAFAQQRRGGGPPDPAMMVKMRVQFLANQLSLTEAQQEKATTIFTDAVTASETLRTNQRANQQSIQEAVKKNDTATIDTLAVTGGTLSGQLLAIESKAEAAFYATLTAEQQTSYDAMPHGGGPAMQRFGPPPPRNQ